MPTGPCALYGVHKMYTQGFAVARDEATEKVHFNGGWYKCKCSERFLAQGNPHIGGSIGKYVTEGGIIGLRLSAGGVNDYWVDGSEVYSTTKTTIEGYQFLAA